MNILADIIKNSSAEKFSELNISDKNLQTTLIYAINTGNYDFVYDIVTKSKLNLNFGNDSATVQTFTGENPLDPTGKIPNPLLCAIAYANSRIIMFLMEHGASKHIVTPRGTNTVHYALQRNRVALAIYLVRNNVTLNTPEVKAVDYLSDKIVDKMQFLSFLEEEAAACNDSVSSAQGRINKFMNENKLHEASTKCDECKGQPKLPSDTKEECCHSEDKIPQRCGEMEASQIMSLRGPEFSHEVNQALGNVVSILLNASRANVNK